MDYPINPVTRGLLSGVAIASQIRQMAHQQELMTLRKQQIERAQEQEDLQTATIMEDRGIRRMTPEDRVNKLTGETLVPKKGSAGKTRFESETLNPGDKVPVQRAVTSGASVDGVETIPDDNRYVKFRGGEYTIPGERERTETYRRTAATQREEKSKDAYASEAARQDAISGSMVMVPGFGQVSRSIAPTLINLRRSVEVEGMQSQDKALDRKSREKVADTAAQSRKETAQLAETGREKVARIAASSRERAAALRGDKAASTDKDAKPSFKNEVATKAQKVLGEDTSGDIDNAIRNAKRFYKNDPWMQKYRDHVVAHLEQMKRDDIFGTGNGTSKPGGQPVAAAKNAKSAPAPPSGPTATNPKTGKKVVWDGEKWQPLP